MPLTSKVADFFSALSDITRVRILGIVYTQPSLTVNEIKDELGGITLQALSYQLAKLEKNQLIKYVKDPEDNRKKRYVLADKHVVHILNDTISHIRSAPECDGTLGCEDDLENLQLLVTK